MSVTSLPAPPRAVRALALLLALGSARTLPADPPSGAPERAAVDAAIDRGARWLLAEQRPDGSFGGGGEALGETALAALALLHAGLTGRGDDPEERRVQRTLAWLDREGPGRERARDRDPGTYATALLLLVLDARGRAQDRPRLQRLVDLLARTQARNGQWGYAGEPGDTGRGGPEVGDNSNTQLALLALGTAVGAGLTVPEETLSRARGWWVGSRAAHGGHGYASGGASSQPSGSMTAAAVACLAVLEAARPPGAPLDRELVSAREAALRWLTLNYDLQRNPGPAQGVQGQRQRNAGRGWLHYYLWTLERAFVLAERERVAGRSWFDEGTAQLLRSQTRDGSWVAEAPLYATCFALLFLTRAAPPPRAFTPPPRAPGAVTPAPAPSPDGAPPPPGAPAPVPADPRQNPPPAPAELVRRALAEGPASLLRLAEALGDPEPAVRQRALEALTALLPEERLEGVDRHPLARGRLLLWLRRNQRWLHARDGRFALLP